MLLLAQALVGLIVAASAAAAAAPHTLTIVVAPDAVDSSRSLAELKLETSRLVSPADYSFAWLSRDQAALGDSFEHLVVVHFQGACRSTGTADPPVVEAGSLATTAVSNGQVLPFVTVDCDRIRRLVAPALAPLPSGAREIVFGRALGRVLAHELYHVLAQTTLHKFHGVSKPCFRLADLVSTGFRFDAASLVQMRPAAQLARQFPPEPARPSDHEFDDVVAGR